MGNGMAPRIQQYGLGYSGQGGSRPVWLRDLPEWLRPLAERVGRDAQFDRLPENCVINEYIPPLGIGPHKDDPAFGPIVACVSLGSDIVMDFSHPDDRSRVSVYVPRRRLWTITGEAREIWRHGIAARLTDLIAGERRPRSRRISVTFRTAASG
jgi:alkylated DNA repair dioxygenase AlkB